MRSERIVNHTTARLLACVGLISLVVVVFSSFLAGCERHAPRGFRVAKYANFHLRSDSMKRLSDPKTEKFWSLTTGGSVYKNLASIYIELPDRKRYLLKDLPESEVAKFFQKADLSPALGECYDSGDYNSSVTFRFREGKLVYAYFSRSDSIRVPFSSTKEGPYVTLPITRETLVKLFGEPKKWGSYRPSTL